VHPHLCSFGAVQERVVDADVVGAALHARLLETDHARFSRHVHEACVDGCTVLGARAPAPEVLLEEALLHIARAGRARRVVDVGLQGHVAKASRAPHVWGALVVVNSVSDTVVPQVAREVGLVSLSPPHTPTHIHVSPPTTLPPMTACCACIISCRYRGILWKRRLC